MEGILVKEENYINFLEESFLVELGINGKEYNLKFPMKYKIRDNKIYRLKKRGKDWVEILLSPLPVFIIGVVNNVDVGDEKLIIALYKYNKWKTGIFPKTTIYNSSNIVNLSSFGVPVSSSNDSHFVDYFSKLEEENINNLMPITAVAKLGWRENNTKFVPYSEDIMLDLDFKLQKWSDGYKQKGKLEDWINEIKSLRDNTLFRFILSSSFASPLLSILGHRIFVVYNYGASRAGKTAMLHTALSVWGNADDLMCTFNTTAVGIERLAGFFNDLVLGIDEKQIQKSQNELEKLIFMLSSGIGKIRGNKTGGVQEINTFNVLVLSTGEQPITTDDSTTGVSTRILELDGSPFNYDEELSSNMYEITKKYYGTAGRKYIEILINKYGNNQYEELKRMFEEFKKELKIKTQNDVQSYISSVAVVVLADMITSKELFEEEEREKSIQMGLEILEKLGTAKEIDVVEKAYENIKSWIISNYKFFDMVKLPNERNYAADDVVSNNFRESFGLYDNDIYYVHRNILKDWLEQNNYSYKKIINGFAEKGYILVSKDENGKIKDKAIQKKFRGINHRMYAFKFDVDTNGPVKENFESYSSLESKVVRLSKELETEKKKNKVKEEQNVHNPNEAKY